LFSQYAPFWGQKNSQLVIARRNQVLFASLSPKAILAVT
jgi:hypothetical protein